MRLQGPSEAKIIILDDQESNVRLLERILREMGGYSNVRGLTEPRHVFEHVIEFDPDLILLDLSMPELDGFGVMEQLEMLIPPDTYLPILVLTADSNPSTRQRALEVGAKDFVTKPFDFIEVLLRIKNLLETRMLHTAMEEKIRQRTEALEEAQMEMLHRLAISAEYRDDNTGNHIQRVGRVSTKIAQALGLSNHEVELIAQAAPLHDLGKIGIPDSILLKPGKLTVEEFAEIKKHPEIGARILSQGRSPLVKMAETIARSHHERWDGKGYPQGLHGKNIPIEGRIVALADTFDALTSKRPYKEAWSVEEARQEIVRQTGKQFDPEVVQAFLEVLSELYAHVETRTPTLV